MQRYKTSPHSSFLISSHLLYKSPLKTDSIVKYLNYRGQSHGNFATRRFKIQVPMERRTVWKLTTGQWVSGSNYIYFLWCIRCSSAIKSIVVNIWMVAHWCKVMDGTSENNHNILFQEVCWILNLPVLNFGVTLKNVMCQLVEMILQQKLSYKCTWHGFKKSFLMTNIKAHNTGNPNVQSLWLVMAL